MVMMAGKLVKAQAKKATLFYDRAKKVKVNLLIQSGCGGGGGGGQRKLHQVEMTKTQPECNDC